MDIPEPFQTIKFFCEVVIIASAFFIGLLLTFEKIVDRIVNHRRIKRVIKREQDINNFKGL